MHGKLEKQLRKIPVGNFGVQDQGREPQIEPGLLLRFLGASARVHGALSPAAMAAYIEHGKKQAGGASVFTVAALGELWLQYAIGTPEYIPEAFAKLEPTVVGPPASLPRRPKHAGW